MLYYVFRNYRRRPLDIPDRDKYIPWHLGLHISTVQFTFPLSIPGLLPELENRLCGRQELNTKRESSEPLPLARRIQNPFPPVSTIPPCIQSFISLAAIPSPRT